MFMFLSQVVDGDYSYITVVNVKGWGSSMKDLDKFILTALFKSKCLS